jgi:hypothetical protein
VSFQEFRWKAVPFNAINDHMVPTDMWHRFGTRVQKIGDISEIARRRRKWVKMSDKVFPAAAPCSHAEILKTPGFTIRVSAPPETGKDRFIKATN